MGCPGVVSSSGNRSVGQMGDIHDRGTAIAKPQVGLHPWLPREPSSPQGWRFLFPRNPCQSSPTAFCGNVSVIGRADNGCTMTTGSYIQKGDSRYVTPYPHPPAFATRPPRLAAGLWHVARRVHRAGRTHSGSRIGAACPPLGSRRLRQLREHQQPRRRDGRGLRPTGQLAGELPARTESRVRRQTRVPHRRLGRLVDEITGRDLARSPPWYSTCGPIRSRGSPTRSSWNSNVPVKSVSSACRASGPSGAPSTSSSSDFGYAGYGKPVSAWQGMEEFVVVFEADKSGRQGVVLIDNIRFEP